jgi:hypothetical protein
MFMETAEHSSNRAKQQSFKYSVLFGHYLEIVVLKIYYFLVTIYCKVKDVETYDVYTIFFFQ